jgi:hypothetical protein
VVVRGSGRHYPARRITDVVVTFCVPNIPNLGGVNAMVSSFRRNDLAEVRGGRELKMARSERLITVPRSATRETKSSLAGSNGGSPY